MSEEPERQIRHAFEQLEREAAPHELPSAAQMWSRLQFRLAYRPSRDREVGHMSTLLAPLYVLAFLVWRTWSGWPSAGLIAVLAFAAAAATFLLLHLSRKFDC